MQLRCAYLGGIVDPLQGHVAEDHGQQVGEGADRVVRRPGDVGRVLGERGQHGPCERVVHHALHEHQRQRVRKLLGAVRTTRDPLLEYAVEEVAHEYAGGAHRELGPFVHRAASSRLRPFRTRNTVLLPPPRSWENAEQTPTAYATADAACQTCHRLPRDRLRRSTRN